MATPVVSGRRTVALRLAGIAFLSVGLLVGVIAAVGIASGPPETCWAWSCSPTWLAGPIWQMTFLGIAAAFVALALLMLHRAKTR